MYTVSCFFPSWLRLQEILEIVYVADSVKHMLTGKATSLTIRWYLLVYGALNTILLAHAYNVHVPESPDDNDEDQHICQSFK